MSSEALGVRARVRRGAADRASWLQLVRFGVVGASGYVVNLAVYAAAVHLAGIDYRVAAVLSFLVSVGSNFLLNRAWTFTEAVGRGHVQAARFFTVSVAVFGVAWVGLQLLVSAGLAEVPAQAIAVALGTPLNFLGNKLWSFAHDELPPRDAVPSGRA